MDQIYADSLHSDYMERDHLAEKHRAVENNGERVIDKYLVTIDKFFVPDVKRYIFESDPFKEVAFDAPDLEILRRKGAYDGVSRDFDELPEIVGLDYKND